MHLRKSICLFLGLSCVNAWPQGEVVFNNRIFGLVVAPVYGVEPVNQSLLKQGNTAAGTPAGTQTYTGALLSGSGYSAQLFGGPTNVLPEDLRPLLPATTFQTASLSGFVFPPPRAVSVGDVPEGMPAQLQLRAWHNRSGTVTNWLQVRADPTIPRGESLPFVSLPLGGVYQPPVNPVGLQSFNLATGAVASARIRVNFQTNGASVPTGYLPDFGFVFGDRGKGFSYGWSEDRSNYSRRQNSTNSPDFRYDSFIVTPGIGGAIWEMALTNGVYRVHLAAGDPSSRDAVYRINVEGTLAVNGTPEVGNNWIEGDVVVAVSDGRLTIASAEGSFSNRLCFVEITPISPPEMLVPTFDSFVSNEFHLMFRGDPTVKYQCESTLDFSSWVGLGISGNIGSNLFEVFAPVETNESQQFYRAKTITAPSPMLVYSNDFESTIGPEWSATNADVTPAGARRFLGRFGQFTNRLTLTSLPTHTRLKIAFDLFIFQSWDGNSVTNGPDSWELNVTGGDEILSATFHANTTNAAARQSYPGRFPGPAFLPRTGATENQTLGYDLGGDSIYHLSYTFPHRTNSVQFNFIGRTTEAITNESWGLDNVTVYYEDNPY